MRQMTEVQVWPYLAKRWAQAWYRDGWHTTVLGTRVEGLRGSLAALENFGEISFATREAMSRKIEAFGPPQLMKLGPSHGYRWPLTARGARSRAAFCRRMVRKVRPA